MACKTFVSRTQFIDLSWTHEWMPNKDEYIQKIPWLLFTCSPPPSLRLAGFTNLNICIYCVCVSVLLSCHSTIYNNKNTSFLLKFETTFGGWRRVTKIYWISTHRTRVSEKPNANTNKRILRFMQMLFQHQRHNNSKIIIIFCCYSLASHAAICSIQLSVYCC